MCFSHQIKQNKTKFDGKLYNPTLTYETTIEKIIPSYKLLVFHYTIKIYLNVTLNVLYSRNIEVCYSPSLWKTLFLMPIWLWSEFVMSRNYRRVAISFGVLTVSRSFLILEYGIL